MNRGSGSRTTFAVVLLCVAVALLAVAALRWAEGEWEDRIFRSLAAAHTQTGMDESERAIALLHLSHQLVDSANRAWGAERPTPGGFPLGPPLHRKLIEGGACGDFSSVLARLLHFSGLEARIAHMRVGDVWGGHIVVTARVDGRWVALDPLFDLAFRDGAGRLASLGDLRTDWPRYAAQTPPRYRPDYDYQALRFTNWERVPVLLPLARRGAEAVFGREAVEQFSLRRYFANVGKVQAAALAGASLALLFAAGALLRGSRESQA